MPDLVDIKGRLERKKCSRIFVRNWRRKIPPLPPTVRECAEGRESVERVGKEVAVLKSDMVPK